MLEEILLKVCTQMAGCLTEEQQARLKNVLFFAFKDVEVVEDKKELTVHDENNDAYKIRMYKEAKTVSGRKESTLKQYITEIIKCRMAIGKNFEDITSRDLRGYFAKLQEVDKNSMTTIQNKRRYLNSFWSFATTEGLVPCNPIARIEAFKIPKRKQKSFAVDELEAIRDSCEHIRDRAVVEFLYGTALRISEVISLNVGDIDLKQKKFYVIGKGDKEGIAYISETASFWLMKYLMWRLQEGGMTWEELAKEPLFVGKRGKHSRISDCAIRTMLREVGKKAGLTQCSPHKFRRTFATEFISHGGPIQDLQRIMRHEKIDTTMLYAEIKEDNIEHSFHVYA